jgi:hypothetical protein
MRLLLPVVMVALACSGQKAKKYDPAAEERQQAAAAPVLPPPPALGPDQSSAKVSGC